ncbi:hypothetical protein ACWF94_07485 [Streptomyces sp. NPDC055078]
MTIEDFRPTHVVPREGLPAWEAPDVSRPTEPLDPLLPVQLLDRRGDWGRVLCANGWSAWVDGRLLVAVPQNPPASGLPLARTADPRPLLGRVAKALDQYRRAADELADGRIDRETFRRRTRGLRVGAVVDGESVWLYDAEHERWVYADGGRTSTFAAPSDPAADRPEPDTPQPPPAPPEPPEPLLDAPRASGGRDAEPTRADDTAADRPPPGPAPTRTRAAGEPPTTPPPQDVAPTRAADDTAADRPPQDLAPTRAAGEPPGARPTAAAEPVDTPRADPDGYGDTRDGTEPDTTNGSVRPTRDGTPYGHEPTRLAATPEDTRTRRDDG